MYPTYWSNPPRPFLPGSKRAPVPGWGVNPAVAGPYRTGVGAVVPLDPSLLRRQMAYSVVAPDVGGGEDPGYQPPSDTAQQDQGIPWWYFAAGAVVVTAGVAVAYNMGVFGKK